MLRYASLLVCLTLLPAGSLSATAAEIVPIVVSGDRPQEIAAAEELGRLLGGVYPQTKFLVEAASPQEADGTRSAPATIEGGPAIYVGTKESQNRMLTGGMKDKLAVPGSYVVFTRPIDGCPAGCVVGADVDGLRQGIYGLARKLGWGFYFSFDTPPERTAEQFSLDAWALEDRPLVPLRMTFDWHNFLSGCSTWNLEDWRRWIAQSQKLGYNAVMVHAYGNNPMAGFAFQGVQKPVGYLSSTRVGRDWSTNHVNDVRRLFGGEVFDGPVFGSVAAVEGSDAERTRAAQELMAGAFASAEERGVDVYFAVDVDTPSANPQELIGLLPDSARFDIGDLWLARPDTPEGYALYKAQVAELLDVYPQIDCLVVWHRKGRTPWMEFALDRMPRSWQEEYRAELAKTPKSAGLWHAHNLFAHAKIVEAFQRAVRELGRDDVRIAFGSWDFLFLPAADRFLPEGVPFIPLDWMVLRDASVFDTPEQRAEVAAVAAHRPVIPIAWAHHDDGNYVGRPYTPQQDFYDLLADMKCDSSGFGIIHWTTKPLDLYFASLANQVWASSRNEPLAETCRRMAADCLGREAAESFGRYLEAWVTTMPKIGRETSDFFIDHELTDLPGVEAAHRKRMELLDAVDASALKPGGREWLDYFRGLERYVLDIYRTENALTQAKRQYDSGNLEAARRSVAECRPEEVIRRFAEFSQFGGLTRGEEGLVVSMNTRWLPHYVRFRQQVGLEPVRLNFAATSHDLLAQSRGIFTFHFDAGQNVWQTLGNYETGASVFALPDTVAVERGEEVNETEAEICRTGIESDSPLEIVVAPILRQGSRSRSFDVEGDLPAGRYRLSLLWLDPEFAAAGHRVFDVSVATSTDAGNVCRFAPAKARYLRVACRGSSANAWNSIHEIRCAAKRGDAAVTASGSVEGCEPAKAGDGDASTRWAVEGRDHWIQLALDPSVAFDEVAIDWYEGDRREYDFDLMVSDHGDEWTRLNAQKPQVATASAQIDVAAQAGGRNHVLKRSFDLDLDAPGTVRLTLIPVKGKALLCGVVLEPVGLEN